jgi:hypothetical protein
MQLEKTVRLKPARGRFTRRARMALAEQRVVRVVVAEAEHPLPQSPATQPVLTDPMAAMQVRPASMAVQALSAQPASVAQEVAVVVAEAVAD